jgi:hypothetical protein
MQRGCRLLVHDFTGVAREGAEQGAVSVHDDEAKLLVRLEQLAQRLGMELVVAKVQRGVDGLEGLEVDVDLALLAFCGDDFTAVDDKAIGRDLRVELQTLLGGRDGREHGQTVDAGLDVGGGTKLFGQHLGRARDLVLGRCACQWPPCSQRGLLTDDERDHGCAIAAGSFKTLDQLLDLPDLDVLLGVVGLLLLRRHGRGVCGLGGV